MDNLSAATHELRETGGRTLTTRFRAVLDHFELDSSRIRPGEAHENGVVEKGHDLLKSALDQALRLRGSRDFPTVAAYLAFVAEVVERDVNAGRGTKIAEERTHLRALPSTRLPEYTPIFAEVRRWSTIQILKRTYSVPSRLIGHRVEVLLYADVLEVRYAGKLIENIPRLRRENTHRIDYRRVIWSLVRKPGAFAHYRYREDLFPSLTFRRAYDALRDRRGDRADVEYVRACCTWRRARASRWSSARSISSSRAAPRGTTRRVKALAQPEAPAIPSVHVGAPDLADYDRLLGAEVAS